MKHYKYLQNTYLYTYQSFIKEIGEFDGKNYIILCDTIFYPQGGGQEYDKGYILQGDLKIKVTNVRKYNEEVLHFIDELPDGINLSKEVKLEIDKKNRLLNARLHTAGHLIALVVEEATNLAPSKGHHYQEGSYAEFSGDIGELKTQLPEIESRLYANIEQNLAIYTSYDPNGKLRYIQIENHPKMGCGGTHVKSLGEIGKITINKIKNKKGKIRVSYSIS